MGLVHVEATVTGPSGKKAEVELLVDGGAFYSVLPQEIWKQIELSPKRRLAFTLADVSTVERPVSECHIALPQGEAHTPVVLGEPGDAALLGVVTLENLGLVLDPFRRTLRPIRARLG